MCRPVRRHLDSNKCRATPDGARLCPLSISACDEVIQRRAQLAILAIESIKRGIAARGE
jgi:hypothetical protein